ncbi:MAG: hypothetical protein Q4P78_05445 [Rothia sp. (in: high G+C Gram-positive bacteria)]|uniref:hypothetical protein n=1 Tax=Rothia sp. (in: high G+C Gram-positive bacteria) TaxID=1885016 RepID=UPI0026E0DD4F|nr:hypothetical protein [Rothia sp. (in: high G+C Gram-positive bacteria)]MDO5750631.1 hypothetical protein [Rothia sp. (in: high G+C Gram-positive bacteria)]
MPSAHQDLEAPPGWELSTSFGVGGLEWIGFSRSQPHQLLVISSQKVTLVDCATGQVRPCECEYDEDSLTAVCTLLPDEFISLAGQYGGALPLSTEAGDRVRVEALPDPNYDFRFNRYVVFYTPPRPKGALARLRQAFSEPAEQLMYAHLGYYVCGFSYDGEYFVLVEDTGITILKRSRP